MRFALVLLLAVAVAVGVATSRAGNGGGLSGAPVEAAVTPPPAVQTPAVPAPSFLSVKLDVRRPVAFEGARIVARIRPHAYDGRAILRVLKDGEEVARKSGIVRRGKLSERVPLPGIGRFLVRLELPARPGFVGRVLSTRVWVPGQELSAGDRGPAVRQLTTRLVELGYHLPEPTSTFTPEVADAVIAFQKASGLERTGSVSVADWRRLGRAQTPRPRHARPANHLEVDIARQILLVVRGGRTTAVLPVSTGALDDTPEGAFAIRRKNPWTTTWLGPGLLYRAMTFWKDEIAVHGYPSVPPYPASHGCVRVPMWAADWLYRRTPVGQRIYVY